jgi:ABC-type lipoprotein release transport system permease subunit
VTFIADRITAGSYLASPGAILLGHALADSLRVKVGDQVSLMVQSRFGRPVARKFAIGGIFRTELASFDRNHLYLCLATAQNFLDAAGVVTEIAVKAAPDKAVSLAEEMQMQLGSVYQVRPWQENVPDLEQLIELNDTTMGLLVIIVFAIVAMGISNTMTTVIFERFREFGTLAAIGTPPRGIVSLVVLESFFLGLLAAIIGSLAGIAACALLARRGLDLSRFISTNQYFSASHVLKAYLLPGDLALAIAVTLVTALLAGLYPAIKAARLAPVEALVHV